MEFTGKIKEYENAIIKEIQAITVFSTDRNLMNEFNDIFKNILADSDDPKILSSPSKKVIFVIKMLLQPFLEISDTLNFIEDITIYLRTFPYKRQGISRVKYLQYHLGNCLGEIYILKERLKIYSKQLYRAYEKCPDFDKKDMLESVGKLIEKRFKAIDEIRHGHVHRWRYTDTDIDRLNMLEMVSLNTQEITPELHALFLISYREIRRKNQKMITSTIKMIHEIVEQYFKILCDCLISNGKLIYPTYVIEK